jgi:zinc and cadmium transporter
MAGLVEVLASVFCVSMVSLVGVFGLSVRRDLVGRFMALLIAFASGSLLSASFFDMVPEVYGELGDRAFSFVLAGLVFFFVVEKFIHWHHCGREECSIKPVGYLNLLGDGLHNFIDGVVIAAAYLSGFKLGLLTTLVIIVHEIPQEFGDFAVLLHAGFTVRRALFFNFLSALTAVAGGLAGFMFLSGVSPMVVPVVGVAAGGLLYIATADLMPELHKERNARMMFYQTAALLAGIFVVYCLILLLRGWGGG